MRALKKADAGKGNGKASDANIFPRIGIDILVVRKGSFLVGQRTQEDGWALPGGKLELNETIKEGALRELREETGLAGVFEDVIHVTENRYYGPHFVNLLVLIRCERGAPKVLEPDCIGGWQWIPLDKIPKKMFLGQDKRLASALSAKDKKIYHRYSSLWK